MSDIKVLALVGSLREGSFNLKLAQADQKLAPSNMHIEIYVPHELPLYNQDLEKEFPAAAAQLKQRIKEADGVIVVTPEYNFGYPAVTKNMLDWQSRPPAENALHGKPVIMQSASMSWAGGLRSQSALRQVFDYLEARLMYFPQVCVGLAQGKFSETGELTDELAIGNITKQLAKFAEFI